MRNIDLIEKRKKKMKDKKKRKEKKMKDEKKKKRNTSKTAYSKNIVICFLYRSY